MFVVVMLFISWLLNEPAWAYGALGLTGLATVVQAASKQNEANKQRVEAFNTANELLKSLQAKMN